MQSSVSLFPVSASEISKSIDNLYFFEITVSVIMTVLIFSVVFIFAIKYRRRTADQVGYPVEGSMFLELTWSIIPFLIMLIMFGWGVKLAFDEYAPPKDAYNIYVVGKQWMWKVQYPEGQREINELHVPIGRPVRITMASEDVIHSFFIPAFRVKHDVVPGHYDNVWFTATKPGRYHIFCAEYCGTEHSGMIGWVTAMEPTAFENWLAGSGAEGSMASQGQKLFEQLGCSSCHLLDEQGRCPVLRGVYGSQVLLDDGRTVLADDAYIRESILNPNAKIVAGFHRDVMPTFQGQVSEENLLQLVEYVKSLAPRTANQGGVTNIPSRGEANSEATGNISTGTKK